MEAQDIRDAISPSLLDASMTVGEVELVDVPFAKRAGNGEWPKHVAAVRLVQPDRSATTAVFATGVDSDDWLLTIPLNGAAREFTSLGQHLALVRRGSLKWSRELRDEIQQAVAALGAQQEA